MSQLRACNQISDGFLLSLCQSDDPTQGWSAWYHRDQHFLLAFVQRKSFVFGDIFLAEDIVQETFEKAFLNIQNGRYQYTGAALRAYLVGIAKNLLKDAARHTYREPEPLPENNTVASKAFNPELDLIVREHIGFIKDGWQGLRPRQKDILFLSYVEGKNSAEVATRLGLTRANTRIIAMRGIKTIQQTVFSRFNVDISAACIRTGLRMFSATAVSNSL